MVTTNQFVRLGEHIRFIDKHSKMRRDDWPEGHWQEFGVEGTVTEYHPESPSVRVGGEYFEAIPEYAVVTWDFGGATCIDPEDEGKRWERF